MAVPLRPQVVSNAASARLRSTYVEHPVDPALASIVACAWDGTPGWSRTLRVLPDGGLDLVWSGDVLWVAPPAACAIRHAIRAEAPSTGLRLRPGAAGGLLGATIRELGVTPLRLVDLWGKAALPAEARLRSAKGPAKVRAVLEAFVKDCLADGASPDRRTLAAAALIDRGVLSLDDIARRVASSPRDLRRRFHIHVGFGPKTLQRIRRFQAFRSAGLGGGGLAGLAAETGYADQAHLSRECRRLAGAPPSALI